VANTPTVDELPKMIDKRVFAIVLVPFGLGYFLSYLFRTVNVVIAPDLAADLRLTAADLGFLTSIYFVLFAAFQTPLGVILDRYGPRRVQVILLFVAALGSVLFAISDSMLVLTIARSLIGLGVSGCLMAALKANAQWFPVARLPFVNACTMSFGTFGALTATIPVEMLAGLYGWRMIFVVLAVFTAALALVTAFVIPDHVAPKDAAAPSNYKIRDQFRDLGAIYCDRFFWQIAVVTMLHGGVFLSYQALWMGPWLADVAGYSQVSVANAMLFFNIGMFAGVVGFGVLADRLQKFGFGLMTIVRFGVGASLIIQIMFAAEITSLAVLMCAAFGFFGSSTLLVYALLGQNFSGHMVGKVNTAQNMMIFIGAFVVQWGIGVIIDFWPAVGEGRYDPAGHQVALSCVIALEVLAYIWLLMPSRMDKSEKSNSTS
jgi:predicted MFS family arabinose efflux permease